MINHEILEIHERKTTAMETNIIYKEESYSIMGACFEVCKKKCF